MTNAQTHGSALTLLMLMMMRTTVIIAFNVVIAITVIITANEGNAGPHRPGTNFTMEINEEKKERKKKERKELRLYWITLKAIPNKWALNPCVCEMNMANM